VTIEEIMELQAESHPGERVPRILTTLCEAIFRLNGHKSEGIFRYVVVTHTHTHSLSHCATNNHSLVRSVPGDTEKVQHLRVLIDNNDYSLEGTEEPNAPASLLKLWLRELAEPLIPNEL
jgi:Rho GTPase-activating protein 39